MVIVALSVLGMTAYISLPGKIKITWGPTGLATGSANISVSGTADITLTDNTINFSAGYVNTSQTVAWLVSNISGSSTGNSKDCAWLTPDGACANMTSSDGVDNFTIVNNGTVTTNVTINAASEASTWLIAGAQQFFKAKNQESGSCGSGSEGYLTKDWAALTTSNAVVCSNLRPTDSSDTIAVFMNISIPANVSAGTKSNTITFTAAQSG